VESCCDYSNNTSGSIAGWGQLDNLSELSLMLSKAVPLFGQLVAGFPSPATRVQSQVRSRRIFGGLRGTKAGFLRVLLSSPPNRIQVTALTSPAAVTTGPLVADLNSRLSQPKEIKKLLLRV
jgi:hypothetical protein